MIGLQRHDTTEVLALLDLTNEFLRRDLNQATSYAMRVMHESRLQRYPDGLSGGYAYMAGIHQTSGNLDSALYYLDQLKALVTANPSRGKIRHRYNSAAGLYYKNIGQYKTSLPYLLDNLRLATEENETRAGLLLNIGNVYQKLSEYKNAVTYHLQSLTLFEKLGNKRGQSYCYQSLGGSFFYLNQFQQAKAYYTRAYHLKKELNDKRGVITSTVGLGDIYKEYRQYEQADKYYTEAIAVAREMKLPADELLGLHQRAMMFKRKNDMAQARGSFKSALKLARQVGDSTLSAKIRSELVEIDLREQKKKETEETLLSNLETVIRGGDRQSEMVEYGRLSEYYAAAGQYDKAYDYIVRLKVMEDTLEGKTVLLQMKELEEQYKSDQKEKEIALLRKDQELKALQLSRHRANTTMVIVALISVIAISLLLVNRYRIQNRAKRMMEMERMRNAIARDLHDDIGSTLSSINIISQLALQEKNGTAAHFQRIAHHSSNMMESMSDIVWSINPNNDSLEQVVGKLKEFGAEILDPLEVSFSLSGEESFNGLPLDVTVRKNLFLIFKEAINNAAKYSGADAVRVTLEKRDNTLSIVISDNGKGFDATGGSSGNGLRNMRERASAINGHLQIRSAPRQGTEILLAIPIT